MAGKTGMRCYPRHLGKPKGKGNVECQASGFLRKAEDIRGDFRQGRVGKEFADVTRGFGTKHPQDVAHPVVDGDPRPIPNSNPPDQKNLSVQDQGWSDQEIEASIKEGRAPRFGY